MKLGRQASLTLLVFVAALSLSILGYGIYRQGQDIKHIQRDQIVQTQYVCERLASLALRISTRTEPIRALLRIAADDASNRGDPAEAARLNGLAERVIVPENVNCK